VNNHRGPPPNSGNYRSAGPPRAFTCFHCGEEGHKKPDCPKLMNRSAPLNLGTGSNAIPIGNDSGKDSNRRL